MHEVIHKAKKIACLLARKKGHHCHHCNTILCMHLTSATDSIVPRMHGGTHSRPNLIPQRGIAWMMMKMERHGKTWNDSKRLQFSALESFDMYHCRRRSCGGHEPKSQPLEREVHATNQ
jgi:hypothetical protein